MKVRSLPPMAIGGVVIALALLMAGCGPLGAPTAGTQPSSPASAPSSATAESSGPAPSRSPALTPQSVSAISARQVWVLGSVGCRAAACPAALYTSADGGHTWRALSAPRIKVAAAGAGSSASVDSVTFADASDGWLSGPGLWVTHDGGHQWRQVMLAGQVEDLAVGSGTVWVLTGRCTSSHGCSSHSLLRSPVSSDHFTVVPLPTALSGAGATPALAADGTTVALLNNSAGSRRSGTDVLEVSTDGGTHWTVRSGPCVRDLGGHISLSGTAVWSVCPSGMLASVSRSTGGAFARVPEPGGRPLPNSASLTALGSGSALIAVLGRVYRTSDGGEHWQQAQVPSQVGSAGWGSWCFPDAQHGFAVGVGATSAALVSTGDGGRRWAEVTLP